MKKHLIYSLCMSAALMAAACADDKGTDPAPDPNPDPVPEEYYAGGKLGTAFNTTSVAYEQPTPVVDDDAVMTQRFLNGEALFEKPFTANSSGVRYGLGPLYIRTSCLHCHPGYGHGKRIEGAFNTNQIGNGYLLVITDEDDNYLTSLTGMPQTRAVAPFKAPIDESKIMIGWQEYTDEWGNKFPDGESYSLIYPEVTIPESAYYVPLIGAKGEVPYAKVRVRLESTIGIYGTGLLDAISDSDLKAEYVRQEQNGVPLNPAIFKNGEWVKTYGTTTHPLRYTYALSRGPLQDAAGANAIWNITNVTRPDRRYHYLDLAGKYYAEKSSQDPEVQAGFTEYINRIDPEKKHPEWHTGDLASDIKTYLTSKKLDAEMTQEQYKNLMIWHRGLAVPAARNTTTEDFKAGKALFSQIGCANCHRPSWTTGSDEIRDPNRLFSNADMPRYPYQKIWPYTDMVQHRLFMKNDIRTGWCRTTPLWGRGLASKCGSGTERLHDCRARNVIEAIMWHGCTAEGGKSDAYECVKKFRALSKTQRDQIVFFIESV